MKMVIDLTAAIAGIAIAVVVAQNSGLTESDDGNHSHHCGPQQLQQLQQPRLPFLQWTKASDGNW